MKIPTVKQKPWWRWGAPPRSGKARGSSPIQQRNLAWSRWLHKRQCMLPSYFLKQDGTLPLGQSASGQRTSAMPLHLIIGGLRTAMPGNQPFPLAVIDFRGGQPNPAGILSVKLNRATSNIFRLGSSGTEWLPPHQPPMVLCAAQVGQGSGYLLQHAAIGAHAHAHFLHGHMHICVDAASSFRNISG